MAIHTGLLSEQHAFRGSVGGKGVFPLWLPAEGVPDDGLRVIAERLCNLSDATLDWASSVFPGSTDVWQDAYDYVLAVLSAPTYVEQLWPTLESSWPRVPLSADLALCALGASLGSRLRAAWERKVPFSGISWSGKPTAVTLGKASHTGDTVEFAHGRKLSGVSFDAWSFQVSGYRVLPEWLAGRVHWSATPAQARETQIVVAAVTALANMRGQLDDWFVRISC